MHPGRLLPMIPSTRGRYASYLNAYFHADFGENRQNNKFVLPPLILAILQKNPGSPTAYNPMVNPFVSFSNVYFGGHRTIRIKFLAILHILEDMTFVMWVY